MSIDTRFKGKKKWGGEANLTIRRKIYFKNMLLPIFLAHKLYNELIAQPSWPRKSP